MDAKQPFKNWRELLGQEIKSSQEKQRLAREVGVSPVTLKRWVAGESQPRDENIYRLARALRHDLAPLFGNLVQEEFPSFRREELIQSQVEPEIPPEVYAEVMRLHSQTPSVLARDTLYEIIFKHALAQLDPERAGMSLVLVGCMPPLNGQMVRSLRQLRGMGTPPWEKDLSRRTIFLGSESVAGSAVMNYRGVAVHSRDSTSFTPANWTDHEQSAIASPILRQARVAGALLASSARAHYFLPTHQTLLDLYAHLATLLFEPHEFYDASEIVLGVMPPLAQQTPCFANFEQRVSRTFEQVQQHGAGITIQQAHQRVWQDIAEELLQISGQE
jgi:transcriptional regulator with XRE-family HTH domain